jgi:hypothetical protein
MGFMCFGSSKQDDPRARKNADIEKQLRADQKKQAKEVKILLLGASPYTHNKAGRNADMRPQVPERAASRQC